MDNNKKPIAAAANQSAAVLVHSTPLFAVLDLSSASSTSSPSVEKTPTAARRGGDESVVTAALEARIRDLETHAQFQANQEAVQAVQRECLLTLRNIRAAWGAPPGATSSNNGTAGPAAVVSNQGSIDEKGLQKKMAKLEYRIQHMAAQMDRLYQENKQLQASSLLTTPQQ